jgi:hypothetical protein
VFVINFFLDIDIGWLTGYQPIPISKILVNRLTNDIHTNLSKKNGYPNHIQTISTQINHFFWIFWHGYGLDSHFFWINWFGYGWLTG